MPAVIPGYGNDIDLEEESTGLVPFELTLSIPEEAREQSIIGSQTGTIPDQIAGPSEDLVAPQDLLSIIPIPPPFKVVTEKLAQSGNFNSPAEIVVSQSGELLQRYLTFEGFTSDLVAAYDNTIINKIPFRIKSEKIDLKNGSYVRFSRIEYQPPKISITNNQGRSQDLFPIMARDLGISYSATIFVQLQQVENGTDRVIADTGNSFIGIGRIPVMLGSVLDHIRLKRASKMQTLEAGECPYDPSGYFIIGGTEYVITLQEKLRVNRFLIYPNADGLVMCRMTCMSNQGSSVVTILQRTDSTIGINLHFLGKEKENPRTLNIFQVFRILKNWNYAEITNSILKYVKPEHQRKVHLKLLSTINDFLKIGDDIKFIRTLLRVNKDFPETASAIQYRDSITKELFPQIALEDEDTKIQMFSYMIARYTEHLAGLRRTDDRDSWSNKRLVSAGPLIDQLFGQLWNRVIRGRAGKGAISDAITNIINKRRNPTLDDVRRILSERTSIITEDFESAFTTHNWGPKGFTKEDINVTDVLKREGSIIAVYSQLNRVSTPSKKKTRKREIRLVQMTQAGYIDPADSPEGEGCGLIKVRSVTCRLTLDRDEIPVYERIRPYLSNGPTGNNTTVCLLNGKLIGWIPGVGMYNYLKRLKLTGGIYRDTTVIHMLEDNTLHVHTDASRPVRPLLVLDTDGELVIQKKNLFGADFTKLLQEGCVEYVDAWEQEYIMLAQSINDVKIRNSQIAKALDDLVQAQNVLARVLQGDVIERTVNVVERGSSVETTFNGIRKEILTVEAARENVSQAENAVREIRSKKPYTHCEMDPSALFGIAASIIPLPNYNQGPRVAFSCNMGRQALGTYLSNYTLRFDTSAKVLAFPTRPIFETQLYKQLGLSNLPAGDNVVLAIMTWKGWNQEDALVINKGAIERGLFWYTVYKTISATEREVATSSGRASEKFGRPIPNPNRPPGTYDNLDERGIVKLGSVIKVGDCVIGRIRTVSEPNGAKREEDASIYAHVGEEGTVDRIFYGKYANKPVIKVKIRQIRQPIVSDKLASRHAQKATIGFIEEEANMPFIPNGPRGKATKPDIIINPHAIPSRMTIAKLFEILGSKAAALRGERVNATAFEPFDLNVFKKYLKDMGYDEWGYETLYNGETGEPFEAQIFMGVCYYQMLRHHGLDKMQARGRGPYSFLTHQPVGGRKATGGQKIGEMERDSFISHGASGFLQDRMCASSDAYKTVFCKNCGTIAITNYTKESKFLCRQCGSKDRSNFGTCTIPFSFKYYTQLLQATGQRLKLGLIEAPSESGPGSPDINHQPPNQGL